MGITFPWSNGVTNQQTWQFRWDTILQIGDILDGGCGGDCISTIISESKHYFFNRLSLNTEIELKNWIKPKKGTDKMKNSATKEKKWRTKSCLVLRNQSQSLTIATVARMMMVWTIASKPYPSNHTRKKKSIKNGQSTLWSTRPMRLEHRSRSAWKVQRS